MSLFDAIARAAAALFEQIDAAIERLKLRDDVRALQRELLERLEHLDNLERERSATRRELRETAARRAFLRRRAAKPPAPPPKARRRTCSASTSYSARRW